MDKKFTGLGRCCGRARLLVDMQLLLTLKSWFNDVVFFYSVRYAYRFFTCQKTKPKTDSINRCARLTAYRCTRLSTIKMLNHLTYSFKRSLISWHRLIVIFYALENVSPITQLSRLGSTSQNQSELSMCAPTLEFTLNKNDDLTF